MKKIFIIMITALIYITSGCKEEGRLDQIDDSAPAPALVAVKGVTGIPGGAVIRYKVPDDKNLLGVKVVYTRNGEICESKASKYTDTLVVEGFGTVEPQEAQLYSVGINGKLSEPVSVPIRPLAPPIQTVRFDIEETFGGVTVLLQENYSRADLAIILMADTLEVAADTLEDVVPERGRQWKDMQTFYTQATIMKFFRRNLKSRRAHFAAYIRDRWGNMSDTVYRQLIPIEEIKLPQTEFRNAMLPTDFYTPITDFPMENLWLDVAHTTCYASAFSGPMPQWFTIDLGHKMSISRFQKWPRPNYELYSGSAPRTFELWGSDNPNPDGSWDESWSLLGEFEQFKPSGYSEGREIGPITDEDRDYWYNRTEFELILSEQIPDPYMTVTHLRFKILSTYTTYGTEAINGQVIISGFEFWGQLKDDEN
jgi:hypothetical protein